MRLVMPSAKGQGALARSHSRLLASRSNGRPACSPMFGACFPCPPLSTTLVKPWAVKQRPRDAPSSPGTRCPPVLTRRSEVRHAKKPIVGVASHPPWTGPSVVVTTRLAQQHRWSAAWDRHGATKRMRDWWMMLVQETGGLVYRHWSPAVAQQAAASNCSRDGSYHLCRRSRRENLNHGASCSLFSTHSDFLWGQGLQKALPTSPYALPIWVMTGCGALKRRVADPLWLAGAHPTLLNSGMVGAPFSPPGSNSTTPLNRFRPLFPSPHPSRRWTHWHMGSWRSPALQNLHS